MYGHTNLDLGMVIQIISYLYVPLLDKNMVG